MMQTMVVVVFVHPPEFLDDLESRKLDSFGLAFFFFLVNRF
jgi:hypothetical protein